MEAQSSRMAAFLENILIMILTIVVLLGVGYLVLVILGWGLKIKSGSREQEGLTQLWASSQPKKSKSDSQNEQDR
jgi:Na+/H+ antiporter NhaC